jgi:hypothetical protein
MGTLWRIVWDGLKAFIFWLVASALLIYFLGYPGYMLSILLGLIFLVCFCALRFTEIVAYMLSLGRRPPKPPPYVPPASPPPPPQAPTYCPKCGSAWVPGARTCANCG